MTLWRTLLIALIIIALVLWAVLVTLNVRPEIGRELPRGFFEVPGRTGLQEPLSGLPAWVASVALFVTLLLAGIANLYLFPVQTRNMRRALAGGAGRVLQITVAGLAFGLLIIVFALGAALARFTFPFTLISGIGLLALSVWGYLAAAYAFGRSLLRRAGWGTQMDSQPVWSLVLGLLLLVPLTRIPYVGGLVTLAYFSLGLGLVIVTHFGSNEAWSLIPLLEDD